MSKYAAGSATRVGLVSESTWGTTPPAPTLLGVPYTTFNMKPVVQTYEDPTIRGDRMPGEKQQGPRSASGQIAVALRPDPAHFKLIESAMNSTFDATNMDIDVGLVQQPFSCERGHTDKNLYTVFEGCLVDKMALVIPSNGMVTVTFDVISKDASVGNTETVADTFTPFESIRAYSHLGGTFKHRTAGGALTATKDMTNLQINLDNGYSTQFTLGGYTAEDATYGDAKVSGSTTYFYKEDALVVDMQAGTLTGYEGLIGNGANTMKISVPSVKIDDITIDIKGTGVIEVVVAWTAAKDPVSGQYYHLTQA